MTGAILVLAAATAAAASAAAPRTIEVTDAATGRISERLNGCHFSPLNHQLAVVHSQMVFGECLQMGRLKWGVAKCAIGRCG